MKALATRVAAITGLVVFILSLGSVARAATILDPLHGFCGTSYPGSQLTTCKDGGVVTPADPSQISGGFGFAADPTDQVGNDWIVAVLVPNTIAGGAAESFALKETAGTDDLSQTAKPHVAMTLHAGVWTSGDLADFLLIPDSSPANKIGAFTVMKDSAATGFYVYWADLGLADLLKQSDAIAPAVPILTLSGSPLLTGMDITSFLEQRDPTTGLVVNTIATAPSSVLQLDKDAPPIPEPSTIILIGSGLVGALRRRRNV